MGRTDGAKSAQIVTAFVRQMNVRLCHTVQVGVCRTLPSMAMLSVEIVDVAVILMVRVPKCGLHLVY